MKVLLVEDDRAILQPLSCLLAADGWQLDYARTVAQALAKIEALPFDAALIDLGLPDGSGFTVSRALRRKGDAAILILTARTEEASIVRGLEDGADDYIKKPFHARELLSRLRAVLRRRAKSSLFCSGDLVVDAKGLRAWKDGAPLDLTAQEYRLLLLFLTHPQQVLARERILQELWDQGGNFVNGNTLTVTVKRLREKLDSEETTLIGTVRGAGYRWEAEVRAQS